MLSTRIVLGIVVLGATVLGLSLVFQRPPPPAEASVFTSSNQCQACHATVHAEWADSQHAQSWINPAVRALSNDFANTDCIDCHAPRPVLETGLANRVLPRESRRSEGVDCIACHQLPDGRMAGTLDRADVACRPVATRDLARVEYCAPCHDQHKTVTQWRETEYARNGIGCVDCHMPFRNGDPNQGRDHAMHGGHSIDVVRKAVTLGADRVGDKVLARVENVGAGHHFPTDERSRAADVFWRTLPKDGSAGGPWRWAYRFRSPYRHEVELVDTLLPAHQTREVEIADPDARGRIEVALFYKLSPYWKDPANPDPEGEARLVHRVVVEP
ncbi:MAG: multiheme c-type cytochrome [Planctomycetota bacterium]|nr:multiheme c-type cytochrome [Planctomycetota bacterium]